MSFTSPGSVDGLCVVGVGVSLIVDSGMSAVLAIVSYLQRPHGIFFLLRSKSKYLLIAVFAIYFLSGSFAQHSIRSSPATNN